MNGLHAWGTRRGFALGVLYVLLIAICGGATARGAEKQKTLVFFGDSLTAGYGLADPGAEAYPALIRRKIEEAHLPWRVVNAGLSGETSAGGLRRVSWVLRQPTDIFVLELGANDGLRGFDPGVIRANLQGIIDRVRAAHPAARIVVAGMRMPPNMGEGYNRAFTAVYPALAEKNGAALIPFLLAGVGGVADLNQGDGMHPTALGDVRVAENVWAVIRPLLGAPPHRSP